MADWVFNATGTGRTGTIQQWTVPTTGEYRITAYGAQGGGPEGGLGARMAGTFELTEGQVVNILIGHAGEGDTRNGGGGGGTFLAFSGAADESGLLLAAGGGGGSGDGNHAGRHGSAGPDGQDPVGDYADGLGGSNGLGGGGGYRGGGGGGFQGDGANGDQSAQGGASYLNGGLGGNDIRAGGFGGGGGSDGTNTSWRYHGGGGGYSGGAGSSSSNSSGEAGGGGSYNAGIDQDNAGAFQSGAGLVEIEPLSPELSATSTWDSATVTYTLLAEWGAIDGATEYRLRLLDDAQALLEEITTTGLAHTFTGLAAETTYHLELTGLDGTTELETLTKEVVTPIGLPGGVSGIQHSFTTDSLTFTWEAAKDADEYRLTLSLDGAEVATQTVTGLTATFATLEDGTQYDLAIQASNAQGDGAIAYYQASTGYLAPAAPVNLRQFEERIIAVICRWDHPEPDKVHDTEVQLLYGDELVMADAFDGPETERTFAVPMASTDYLLRVRAGNPGGWSPWAEATVHTEVFPLIDSRLGVMAATYQEDVLHTDTWDGASDKLKGVVEAVRAEAGVAVSGYSLVQSYFPPPPRVVIEAPAGSKVDMATSMAITVTERAILQTAYPESQANASMISAEIEEINVKINAPGNSRLNAGMANQIGIQSAKKQYRSYTDSSLDAASGAVIGIAEDLQV